MSTRSIIATTNPDHTISAIYCHSDGYPSRVGKLLLDHYTNLDDITRLMGLGDLSWLGDKPEDPGDLWEREKLFYALDREDRCKAFDEYWDDVSQYCKSYATNSCEHSERMFPKPLPQAEFDQAVDDSIMIDYVYLWDGTQWQYKHRGDGFAPLTPKTVEVED